MTKALVIGAGPAGLMAAEALADGGHEVLVAEAKPSPARKFLMAGKSGLNLTKNEPFETFLAAYGPEAVWMQPMLHAFGPAETMAWAETLGQKLFTGSTGRVFPKAMKASPLLRAWLARLDSKGIVLRTGWRWTGWADGKVAFETAEGPQEMSPTVTVLACGGASWARLGSDGVWSGYLPDADITPFAPSNMGVRVAWSDHMHRYFGKPVKGIRLTAGDLTSRGEIVLTAQGIEGGGLYEVSRAVRQGAPLYVDLLPDLEESAVRNRLGRARGKASLSNHLRKSLRLTPEKIAVLMEFCRPLPDDVAPLLKALPIAHRGSAPMDQAISTAGGLRLDAVDDTLMLRERPGVFAAGEMLDWDAPTGGYLITACLATGQWAGRHAADWAQQARAGGG